MGIKPIEQVLALASVAVVLRLFGGSMKRARTKWTYRLGGIAVLIYGVVTLIAQGHEFHFPIP